MSASARSAHEIDDASLPLVQIRYLRALADRIERGETVEKDEQVIDAIEDVLSQEMDREAIAKARLEPSIPYEQVRKDLGLG